MSRHDLSRASDAALLAVARVTIAKLWEGAPPVDDSPPLDPHTRRCLEAFASVLIEDPSESFAELEALRAECRDKTLSERDREIGDWLRGSLAGMPPEQLNYAAPNWSDAQWLELRALVHASRTAPEGEP